MHEYYLEYLEWKRSFKKPKPAPITTPLVIEPATISAEEAISGERLSSSSAGRSYASGRRQ